MNFFCDKKIVRLPKIPKRGHVVRLCELNTKTNLYSPEDMVFKSDKALRKWIRDKDNVDSLSSFYGIYSHKKCKKCKKCKPHHILHHEIKTESESESKPISETESEIKPLSETDSETINTHLIKPETESESEMEHVLEGYSDNMCNYMCNKVEQKITITNIILLAIIIFLIYIIYNSY